MTGEPRVSNFFHRLLWASLLLVAFYFSGCVVFHLCEREKELETYRENKRLLERLTDLYEFEHCQDPAFKDLSFCKGQRAFGNSLLDYFNENGLWTEDQGQWTSCGSIFFLTHLATTIGYGNSHPHTPQGQLSTIFFAFAGIPVMGYALVQVARLNFWLTRLFLAKCFSFHVNTVRRQGHVLASLLVLFLFGGAFVYMLLEDWTYLESLYFCFATLSTVGFGGYLPSSPVSKAFSVFYMISGLGVCALNISVLTGMVAEGHDVFEACWSEKVGGCAASCVERRQGEPI